MLVLKNTGPVSPSGRCLILSFDFDENKKKKKKTAFKTDCLQEAGVEVKQGRKCLLSIKSVVRLADTLRFIIHALFIGKKYKS